MKSILKQLEWLLLYSYNLEVDSNWMLCSVSRFHRVPHAGDAEPNKHKVQLELGCSPVTDPPGPTSSCFRTWTCCLHYFAFEKCSLTIKKEKKKSGNTLWIFSCFECWETAGWTFLAEKRRNICNFMADSERGRKMCKRAEFQLFKENFCCFHVYISCPCSHLKTDWGCYCVCIHLNAAAGIIPAVNEAWRNVA